MSVYTTEPEPFSANQEVRASETVAGTLVQFTAGTLEQFAAGTLEQFAAGTLEEFAARYSCVQRPDEMKWLQIYMCLCTVLSQQTRAQKMT